MFVSVFSRISFGLSCAEVNHKVIQLDKKLMPQGKHVEPKQKHDDFLGETVHT